MSYLVCDKCGQEYQLETSENPADFQCECGGELIPIKISPEAPKKSNSLLGGLEGWWEKQNKPIKAGSIISLFGVGVLIILGIIGMVSPYTNNGTLQNYNGKYMSFQYPTGWYVDYQSSNLVVIKETSSRNSVPQHQIYVNIYGTIDDFNEAMQWNLPSGKTIKTRNINGISCNYTDNSNNNSNVTNTYHYYFEKDGKYVFIHFIVNDTTTIEKLISTFKVH